MKMSHVLIADIRGNEVGRVPYDPVIDAAIAVAVAEISRNLSSMLWSGNIMPHHFIVADSRGRAVRTVPPLKYQGLDNMIRTSGCDVHFELRTGNCVQEPIK